MTWLAFRHGLKKAWSWVQHYWYVPALLLYTLVLMIVFRRDGSAPLEVLNASRESHRKQVEVINEAHTTEIQKREKILRQYNKIMENVETEHDETMAKMDKDKKRRVKDLVTRHHDDPEQLTQLLKLTFGIHYEEG
tara:strand:- start:22 stop:429 length:408 start_codon:yes stop_codon:yes gene_type:complete